MTDATTAPSVREQALEEAKDTTDLYRLLMELYHGAAGNGYVVHSEQIDYTTVPEISVNVEEISDRAQVEHLLELADTAGWEHTSTTPERHRLTFRQRVSDSERRDELLRCDYCGVLISREDRERVFNSAKSRWGCSEEHLRAALRETAAELRDALRGGSDE